MGFEDFDQMDTWDAGKTAGGRHGSMPSKIRMKNLTDKVNGNGNGDDKKNPSMSFQSSNLKELKNNFPSSHFRFSSNQNEPWLKKGKETWTAYPGLDVKFAGKKISPGEFQKNVDKYRNISIEENNRTDIETNKGKYRNLKQ